MSNVIELNIAEIDTVVGGTTSIRTSAPPPINYNRTQMAIPSHTFAASSNYSPSTSMGSSVDTSALQARLDAMR
jgi:hypothetical protein